MTNMVLESDLQSDGEKFVTLKGATSIAVLALLK